MHNLEDKVVYLNEPPSRHEAEQLIKKLTEKGQISLSKHCKLRMKERSVSMQELLICLSKGRVIEDPFLSHRKGGGYEVTIERMVAGEYLKIGACIKFNQRILVITVIRYR